MTTISGLARSEEHTSELQSLIDLVCRLLLENTATREETDQVFFGATVTYGTAAGADHPSRIVALDETDPARHDVSWISPVARSLFKAREADKVNLLTPAGHLAL